MLGDAGSIASLVGVALGFPALVFAIVQLRSLKGETRAAREAAEAARRALGRDLAIADVSRLNERLQALKEIHRGGNRLRALDRYSELVDLFVDIQRRHPGLTDTNKRAIQRAIAEISDIEQAVERSGDTIPRDLSSDCNQVITGFQSRVLPDLEDRLQQRADV